MIKASNLIDVSSELELSIDLFVNAVGYETRAGAIARYAGLRWTSAISLIFSGDRMLSFYDNLKFMRSRGAVLVEDPIEYLREHLINDIEEMQKQKGSPITVGADISSMNRAMIANLVLALCEASQKLETVHFYYMPARFNEPDLNFPTIESIGAVIPEFAAPSVDTSLPVCIVMGVGYEYGLAVGLINRIEPSRAICFQAVGHDEQYVAAVRHANLNFEFGVPNVRVSEYNVLDAKSGFKFVSDVVAGVVRESRAVLVPMGPKIFALFCNLIALKFFGYVSIWRIISQQPPIKNSFPDSRFVVAEISMDEFRPLREKAKFMQDWDLEPPSVGDLV
jgi:hypothetical protein